MSVSRVCVTDSEGVEKSHHWLLDSPDGVKPSVSGVCKHCGKTREYQNQSSAIDWKANSYTSMEAAKKHAYLKATMLT